VRFSVVIATHNRAQVVPRAIRSVLDQRGVDLELVVVDDDSDDDTQTVLRQLGDSRLRVIRQHAGGPSAARNTGAKAASGDWITFLDDDDVALPGWLEGFAELIDPGVGVVCCAVEFRTPDGVLVETRRPLPTSLHDERTALFDAGTFAVRTELLRGVGGYDERLRCSEHLELGIRLATALGQRGETIAHTDRPFVQQERRPAGERPIANPVALYEGTRILIATHRERMGRIPSARAAFNSVLGVNAARLGRWDEARSALLVSVRAEPQHLRHWLRFGVACIPPLGRRIWRISSPRMRATPAGKLSA
jgi:GT2 family glycosyltransferase